MPAGGDAERGAEHAQTRVAWAEMRLARVGPQRERGCCGAGGVRVMPMRSALFREQAERPGGLGELLIHVPQVVRLGDRSGSIETPCENIISAGVGVEDDREQLVELRLRASAVG